MSGKKGMHRRPSTSPEHAEAVRARIQTGLIVNCLENHVLGKTEMSASQVSAALGLLRKVVPDQSENRTDLTVRRAESLAEEQSRLMAEEILARAQGSPSSSDVVTAEPARLHDSV